MVATNITSGHTRIIPCRKERGGVLEQSGEMSNAGGALPWSIQQRSHTPPSPDVDPRTYTRTTAGSVCAPSRHSCLSIPSPICLHAPLLCRPIPLKEYIIGTVVPGLRGYCGADQVAPPSYSASPDQSRNACRSQKSLIMLARVDKPHTCSSNLAPPP